MKDTRKILLALQFWSKDQKQAMQVAKLIADLETRHSDQADFLFVARFDCPQDMEAIRYVSGKFNVHHHISRRRATGWPWGPNELWFETMQYAYEHFVADHRIPDYKAVLTFEADAFPLCPNWIQMLSSAWDDAEVNVLGAMQKYPAQHINGNAMFSLDQKFAHWLTRSVSGCTPHGGWDFVMAPQFQKWGWANSNLFRSWWQTLTLHADAFEQLQREGVAFLHGVKDASVIKHVRQKFNLTAA